MSGDLSLKETHKEWHGTAKSYAAGFVGSLILTAISFILVITEAVSGPPLIYSLIVLALIQAVVQLVFFLHLGQEAKPRWETLLFYFMLLLLTIIVLGTFWIMFDLDERVMSFMTNASHKM